MSKNSDGVRITLLGATETVTGSKYLIEAKNKRLLVDCGLFQGKKELRLRNWKEPEFDSKSLDAIILTHAHIDHTGFLPAVVRYGYRGPIYCTPATKELVKLLLPDSAHLQEEEARYHNLHETSKHHPAEPLYSKQDAVRALELCRTFERGKAFSLFDGITVFARGTGHILGAVSLTFDIGNKRVIFSGDVGRFDQPILPDPSPVEFGDVFLCESTYGDRLHDRIDLQAQLARVITQCVDRAGPLIIPAFAVGRTQTLLYEIAALEREGKIPSLPVYVDSPMAIDCTEIYQRYDFDFDADAKILQQEGVSVLRPRQLNFSETAQDSKRLNYVKGPRIIISASGMVNGGRVLHHMVHNLPNEKATVLFVGYQAEGTRGHTIQSGVNSEVKIFGSYVPIRAQVESISGLSAHGDRSELLRWLKSSSGTPRIVKIVHGEVKAATAFAETLRDELDWNASVGKFREVIEI